MNGNFNIFTSTNQELASFLQKVGQHEAVRIVKKYNIDGTILLAISEENENTEFTDNEKSVLLTVINCFKLQLGTLSRSRQAIEEIEEAEEPQSPSKNSNKSPNNLKDSDNDCVCNKSNDNAKQPESSYLEMKDLTHHYKTQDISYEKMAKVDHLSPRYFTFTKTPTNIIQTENKISLIHSNYLDHFGVSPSGEYHRISNDYIVPTSQIPPVYDKITTDRIKRYVKPQDFNTQLSTIPESNYIEIIELDSSRVDSKKEKNGRKNTGICDFILSFCGYSCFLGCQKK